MLSLSIQVAQTLVDAVSECMRYWVSNCDNAHMCVGSTVGPNILLKFVVGVQLKFQEN